MAALPYGQFGPFVPAGTIDALLAEAHLSDRLATGLAVDAPVSYKFDSDHKWVQRTAPDGAHDTDNLDSSGVLGAALRRAYAKAAGLSTWSPTTSALAKLASPLGASQADTSAPTWSTPIKAGLWALSAVGAGACAYHGYKRNSGSVGWAIGWGVLGGLFPILTTVIAFAEGYAKPLRRS